MTAIALAAPSGMRSGALKGGVERLVELRRKVPRVRADHSLITHFH